MISANLIETIVHAEKMFPQTFADTEARYWGVFFVTPTIRDSHDGNHACILNPGENMTAVVEEIVAFYEGRGLSARINYISHRGDNPRLRDSLAAAGFTVSGEGDTRFLLYQGPSRIVPNPDVQVRRLGRVDADMLTTLTSIGNLRMAKVIQRRVARADDWLFVAKIDGELASVALLDQISAVLR